jgi:hypothetical protein
MQRPEALKFLIFLSKNLKKVLDIPILFCYSTQARLRETAEGALRTLKTIQRRNAQEFRKRSAKIPKEYSTER